MITIRDWQASRLQELIKCSFPHSQYSDLLTLLIYTFPHDVNSDAFHWIKFSILHTWSLVGKLPTVIVAHKHFDALDKFVAAHPEIEIQIEESLIPGDIRTMSYDCITRLHKRFSTDYVLIIQDDGFPIRDNLNDFLGKYDFIGAPCVRDSRRKLMNALGFPCLNGGFSLRSKRICEAAAKSWRWWWRFFTSRSSRYFSEDTFYTLTACISPFFRHRFNFANEQEAFSFAYESLNDMIEHPKTCVPFGIHGKPTMNKLLAHSSTGSATEFFRS